VRLAELQELPPAPDVPVLSSSHVAPVMVQRGDAVQSACHTVGDVAMILPSTSGRVTLCVAKADCLPLPDAGARSVRSSGEQALPTSTFCCSMRNVSQKHDGSDVA